MSALLDFARIKAALSPDDERLLAVLQDPADDSASRDGLLLTLTRWDADVARRAAHPLRRDARADLAHLATFRRVYDAVRAGVRRSASRPPR